MVYRVLTFEIFPSEINALDNLNVQNEKKHPEERVFSNLRTRGAECQMALQYEEDISPSLMLQERKGNPINSQEKKDFFLVSLLQKKGRLAKRNEKVG